MKKKNLIYNETEIPLVVEYCVFAMQELHLAGLI